MTVGVYYMFNGTHINSMWNLLGVSLGSRAIISSGSSIRLFRQATILSTFPAVTLVYLYCVLHPICEIMLHPITMRYVISRPLE